MSARGVGMPSSQPEEEMDGYSPQWRAAVLEVEQARQHYARVLAAANSGETEVDIMWLRLWRAERRRDELVKL
jgi:hypothetical protein